MFHRQRAAMPAHTGRDGPAQAGLRLIQTSAMDHLGGAAPVDSVDRALIP